MCSEWVGTPLSLAAAKAHTSVVQVLLDHGVDVNGPCGYFGSAAHMAFAVGAVQLLEILRRAGACFHRMKNTCRDVYCDILESVRPSFPDSLGSRSLEGQDVISGYPVTLAIIHGNLEAVKFCMDMNLERITYKSYEKSLVTKSKWRNPSRQSSSSILLAIAALDVDMLQLLFDRGVLPDWDEMAWEIHCIGSDSRVIASNALACISSLIRHGLPTYLLETGRNARGDTLLMEILGRAAGEANYEIAKAVLQHGAQVNAVNYAGQTALMIAAGTDNKSRAQCVQLLCDSGAAVGLKDENGRTALRYAEKWGGFEGYEDVRRILLSFGQNGSN